MIAQERWEWALLGPSDIQGHVQTLRWLSSLHDEVVEFGVRGGVSNAALLSGRPKVMRSYDIQSAPEWSAPMAKELGVKWKFTQKSDLDIKPEKCDLLFIDTIHIYDQLAAELALHASGVRKTIALHDTHIAREHWSTEHNYPPGMWMAINEFLASNPDWSIVADWEYDNGLTLLGRDP